MTKKAFKVNVSVVLKQQDKFLLVRRADDEEVFPGFWGIPGGTVEATDQALENALDRECEEEVGVKIANPLLISNNIVDKGDKAMLYLVYKAELAGGLPTPREEIAEVAWLAIEDVRLLKLTPSTLEMIELCL